MHLRILRGLLFNLADLTISIIIPISRLVIENLGMSCLRFRNVPRQSVTKFLNEIEIKLADERIDKLQSSRSSD